MLRTNCHCPLRNPIDTHTSPPCQSRIVPRLPRGYNTPMKIRTLLCRRNGAVFLLALCVLLAGCTPLPFIAPGTAAPSAAATPAPSHGTAQAPAVTIAATPALGTAPTGTGKREPLPSRFDLRETGGVTPARNQQNEETCWAYAAIAAAESSAAYLQGIYTDLSENHMKYALSADGGNAWGFDRGFDGGGNRDMAAAYFARHSGAVLEARDPPAAAQTTRPVKATEAIAPSYTVGDILFLPVTGGAQHLAADAGDVEIIQRAILRFGGVFSDYRHDETRFDARYSSYWLPQATWDSAQIAHAVILIGWDNDFPADHFLSRAPGNGAWIAKNSFGGDYGENGFFYISYYDAYIGSGATVFTNVSKTPAPLRAYQYDPFGNNSTYSAADMGAAWAANVFDRGADTAPETLRQVGLYTCQPNVTVTLSVGQGDQGSSPEGFAFTTVQTVTLEYAGYHTITLNDPIELDRRWFCVQAQYSAAQGNAMLPLEGREADCPQADAQAGQSWASWDGAFWTDLNTHYQNTNLCIKAFCGPAAP